MAKETTEQTVGLCREAMTNVRNAYDKGYKQGYKDGKQEILNRKDDLKKYIGNCETADKIGYERGLYEAWEIATKITKASSTDEEMNKIFGDDFYYMSVSAFFEKYSVQEVMSKFKEYEEKQKQADKEIKIGDEVIADVRKFVVLGIDNGAWYQLWCLDNGLTYDNICSSDLTKTGRSFPQIVELFKQMKEGEICLK